LTDLIKMTHPDEHKSDTRQSPPDERPTRAVDPARGRGGHPEFADIANGRPVPKPRWVSQDIIDWHSLDDSI
jgi:hypothetical protein